MTKIKICGITNLEDAQLAMNLGADMIGFNFYKKSPRYIDPEKARMIIDMLSPNVENAGVFVNAPQQEVVRISKLARLDAVQLHGDESAEYIGGLNRLRVIKAMRLSPGYDFSTSEHSNVDSILLDAFSSNEYGGTGQTCDWKVAERVARGFPKVFLSGGLDADNVVEAITTVRPFAVDACSRLESTKGKKDPRKLEAFVSAVKQLC
jgi:phosphoribosylanthranilate isomerase